MAIYSEQRITQLKAASMASSWRVKLSATTAASHAATIGYCKHCGCSITEYTLSAFYVDTCYSCDDLAASIASARQLLDLEAASYSDYDPSSDSGYYSELLEATGYDYIDNDGRGYRYSRLTSEGM
jgi:hypothetical protein